MKKIIIFIMLLLLIPFAFSTNEYYMIEDFEEYTPYNISQVDYSDNQNFFEESNKKWECDNYYNNYHCSITTGTVSSPTKGFSIQEFNGNKYLNLVSDFQDSINDYNYMRLQYNKSTPFEVYPNENIIFEYDIQLVDSSFGLYQGVTEHQVAVSGFYSSLLYSSFQSLGSGIGGLNLYLSNETTFTNWTVPRPIFKSNNVYHIMTPNNIDNRLSVGDTNWHTYTMEFEVGDFYEVGNTYCNITQINLFLDGVLYESIETNLRYICSGVSQSDITPLYFISQAGFNVNYDNIKLYRGDILTDDFTGSFTCPYENCIYYDGFDYVENYSLNGAGYVGGYNDFYIDGDSKIYPNANSYISHGLTDYSYNKIENNQIFKIFSNYTPESLDTDTLYYSFSDVCENGNTVSEIIVLFDYYDNTSSIYSGYETSINFFRSGNTGAMYSIGSLIVMNGQNFGFSRIYDTTLNKYYMNFYSNSNYETGFLPQSSQYVYNFNSPCDKISYFQIERGGNSDIKNFYAIEELSYTGSMLDSETGLEFLYTNETKNNESTIKTDIGENLHNIAFSGGFKTSATKMLFWFLLMGLCLFFLIHAENVDNLVKVLGAIFVIVVGFVSGYFLKFIPPIVFAFGLLIFSVVISIAFIKIFKGDNSSNG